MFRTQTLSRDASAALVVVLVALPLCMGIAVASGVPAEKGLLTGIIGGLVVGFLSGSPLQVSGPAAGLAIIVLQLVQTQGVAALAPVLMLAGALQCLAAVLRLGQWFRAISPAVVHGMLAGIGVLIVLSQCHVLLDAKPFASGLANLTHLPAALDAIGNGGEWALADGLLTVAAILAWEKLRPRRLRLIPGALVGVAVGAGFAALLALPVAHAAVPDRIWQSISLPRLDAFSLGLLPAAAVMALIASAESLLSAAAIDRMQHHARTAYNRELFAQGAGNMLCGLLGGLPMTGVIVRSSANVQAGAQTRLSTILHGLMILLVVTLAPGVLRLVPTASLAGVLLVIGVRLVSFRHARDLLARYGWLPAAVWAVTLAGVVGVDLLTGVIAGLALSMVELATRVRRLGFSVDRTETASRLELRLLGAGSFLRLPRLMAAVEGAGTREVHIRTAGLTSTDHTFADALHEWDNGKTAKVSE